MAKSGTRGEGAGEASGPRTPSREIATLASGGVGRAEEAALALGIGSVLGRYVVLERLGAGAMGVVYAAFDPDLDRKIALKLLPPYHRDSNRVRREERLVREAKAIAKLSHPNIVGIFDVGVHKEQVFLAMEFLGGGTLKRWMTVEKRQWRDTLKIFIEAGRGLAAAHTEGLIHRDFKPENVLLDRNGVAKVVDFGLVSLSETSKTPAMARADEGGDAELEASDVASLDLSPATLTRTGALMGTPAYMAPEQFLGRPVDARTDQFAFCASLYEALYGERPFAGDTVPDLAKAVTNGELRAAPAGSPVPGWVRKVLVRGLATESDQRYASLPDLLQTLSRDPIARRKRRIGVAVALIATAVAAFSLHRSLERRRSEIEQRIAARLAEGNKAVTEARALKAGAQDLRNKAFAFFDAHDREPGERVWTQARTASASFDAALERAQRALEAGLAMDRDRTEAQRLLAEVIFERAALAEQDLRREDLARHLASLEAADLTGEQRQRWRQPGSVSIGAVPAGAKVTVERFETGAGPRITLVPVGQIGSGQGVNHPLPPGSYRLRIEGAGYVETFFPFVVRRGRSTSVELNIPATTDIPQGFRYVPAGRFLYGDHDEEWRLSFLNTVPLHERERGSFLIKTHETTFAEWIEFLSSLAPGERAARLPASKAVQGTVALNPSGDRDWKLRLSISNRSLEATTGQKVTYPGRSGGAATQDWLKMPVVGISPTDIRAYLGWLAATQRVPGARFCKDSEWERAARGADERVYPSSLLRLPAEDANVDATYGRIPGAYGPDEVGRHPASRSPFGLDDMAGNAWEIVEGDGAPQTFLLRGGGYYHAAMSSRSTNREPIEPETRSHMLGFRVCADWPRRTGGGSN
jgi:serine/threonine protein kinase/formylglycine-generating enzyme required for sulfatase activity